MLKALIKTMRPKQWAKNVFLLAALVFDRKLTNVDAILNTFLGVIAFSLIASVVYIINDIADLDADRQHPTKRSRLQPRIARPSDQTQSTYRGWEIASSNSLGFCIHPIDNFLSASVLAFPRFCCYRPYLSYLEPDLFKMDQARSVA